MLPVLTNKTDLSNIDLSEGFIVLINKPQDWTSFDVVKKLRGFLKVRKAGHGGTLDPFATGLMTIGIAKGTKTLSELSGLDKSYRALIHFGSATNTYDCTGTITEQADTEHLDLRKIKDGIEALSGEILQLPPMFSAKKVNGVRLYKLARKNKEVERKPQKVKVHQADILNWKNPDLEMMFTVSKGTYIRSIAHDLGKFCGLPAHLAQLERTAIGPYRIEDSFKLDAFFSYYRNWHEHTARS